MGQFLSLSGWLSPSCLLKDTAHLSLLLSTTRSLDLYHQRFNFSVYFSQQVLSEISIKLARPAVVSLPVFGPHHASKALQAEVTTDVLPALKSTGQAQVILPGFPGILDEKHSTPGHTVLLLSVFPDLVSSDQETPMPPSSGPWTIFFPLSSRWSWASLKVRVKSAHM